MFLFKKMEVIILKEKIEKKLEEYAEGIIAKENPSIEDINFIVFLLNRIEIKENAEIAKAEKEQSDKLWKEKMSTMIDTFGR